MTWNIQGLLRRTDCFERECICKDEGHLFQIIRDLPCLNYSIVQPKPQPTFAVSAKVWSMKLQQESHQAKHKGTP